MAKINLLSSKVFNRIAAGEVVDRPYSVVKELVENSLDSGANTVTIEIEDGGLSLIKITDNGCGIEKNDLKKALLPHATSKISKVEDLDNILTLGFRGEALASIASVSKMSISSKPENQDNGAQIYSEGEQIGQITDCALDNGTEICVKNLFFNAPVRAKFLHSKKSEEGEISSTVARFILGHPSVSFKLISDGKTLLQSYGDGVESAFVCVYGAKTVDDCFFIDTEKNGIKIKGYIGKHYFTKSNRTYQTVFLNGRYVVNQTISSAIGNAYSSYLMKRQYPFFVLSIDMPSDIVDVNVHPNKIDVRFQNNQIIYGSIYSVISKVLDGTSEALNIVMPPAAHPLDEKNTNHKQIANDFNDNYATQNKPKYTESYKFDSFIFADSETKSIDRPASIEENKKDDNAVDIFLENKAYIEKLERERKERAEQNLLVQQNVKIDKKLIAIGQVLNTYLIVEDGVDIYFIDQHAAHERILFDKLIANAKSSQIPTQPLLIPFTMDLNNLEFDFLSSKFDTLNSLGFEIDEFGNNSIKISAIPVYLSQMNLSKFIDDILYDIGSLKNITATDILTEKLAQKACKSAIKSGDKMSDNEINALLELMQNNLGLKCPHGRPVCIKITRTEIDKWFKRII